MRFVLPIRVNGRHDLPAPERHVIIYLRSTYMLLKSVGDIPTSFRKKREK